MHKEAIFEEIEVYYTVSQKSSLSKVPLNI